MQTSANRTTRVPRAGSGLVQRDGDFRVEAISGWMAPEAPAACSGRLFGDTLRGKSNEFFEAIVRMKL